MAFTLLDLLQGVTPTFDAQAIPDSTDWSILAAADEGFGVVAADSNRTAPAVTPCIATCTGPVGATTLSTLVGAQNLTISAVTNGPIPTGGGFFSCTASGSGTAFIGYTSSNGTTTLNNCFYISGGSGNIPANATLTFIMALQVAAGYVMSNNGPVSVSALAISIQNVGGSAWQALPASATDRKDTLVSTTAGVLSIVQGTACAQLDWTRNNGSYTNAPPVKAAWVSGTPIVLTEIYVPGVGSTHTTNVQTYAGMLTDKSTPVIYPQLSSTPANTSADTPIVSASTPVTCFTSGTIQPGAYVAIGSFVIEALAATVQKVSIKIGAGTATVQLSLFLGVASGESTLPGVIGECITIPIAASFAVTAAGTIIVQAQSNTGSSSSAVKNATPTAALGQCSGIQFIRTA